MGAKGGEAGEHQKPHHGGGEAQGARAVRSAGRELRDGEPAEEQVDADDKREDDEDRLPSVVEKIEDFLLGPQG